MKEDNLAQEILGDAPTIIIPNSKQNPLKERLTEEIEDGMVIKGFCTNCGSYPEFPIESALKIAEIGKFTLPSSGEIKNFYLLINQCGVCKLQITPSAELKNI